MSVETKVLSASTRTNLEALKHHMKKLGFEYFEEKKGWIEFCPHPLEDFNGNKAIDASNHISICLDRKCSFAMIDIPLYDKLSEAKKAIFDFYEAEGITDED